jgi:mono/diheme cytochrome c family protein
MERRMKKLVLFALFGVFTACGTKIPEPTPEVATAAKVELATLVEGKGLYTQHCGSCHPHKKVSAFTSSQWETILPKMVNKTNKKYPGSLNDAQKENIRQYVLAFAKQAK